MKSLKIIQTLSKLGKIFSKIVYICGIVGLCGCGVGLISMLCIGNIDIKIGGATLHSIIEAEAGTGVGTIWSAIFVGMILCGGEIAVSHKANRYFSNELSVGTPFTLDGAKELLNLGISTIWISILSSVLAQVAHGVVSQLAENVEPLSLDENSNVMLGIVFIIISVICRYGAEMNEKTPSEEPVQTVQE